jgi:hypothetical protein
MRRVVQRSLLFVAAAAALIVGISTYVVMREPMYVEPRSVEDAARADEPPPPLVPAEAAAPTVELT